MKRSEETIVTTTWCVPTREIFEIVAKHLGIEDTESTHMRYDIGTNDDGDPDCEGVRLIRTVRTETPRDKI